jgi:hypothetical protein
MAETPQQTPAASPAPPAPPDPSTIQSILDPIKVDKQVKAKAWNAWHSAKSPEQFKQDFDALDLPKESKAALWNAKFKPHQKLPKPEGFFATHEKTREAILGAFSGIGVPETQTPIRDLGRGLVKTFDLKPQGKDEMAAVSAGLPLPVYRLAKGMVQQAYGLSEEALSSVDWKNFKLKPENLPRTAHGLAGLTTMVASFLLGGKKAPEVVESAPAVAKAAVRSPGMLAQEIAGAGVEPVARAAERRAGTVEGLQEGYHDAQAKAQRTYAEKTAEHSDKVAKMHEEHVQKTLEAKGARADQAKLAARKQSLTRGREEYGKLVGDNVESTHAATRGALDQRWNGLRDRVGPDTPLNSVALSNAVEEGRATLQGAPADLKVFNDLMNQMESSGGEVEEHIDTAEGAKPKLRPLTWDEGRTHFSALGDKLYSGELPGNVYRAVKKVRESLDSELSRAAEESVTEKEGASAGAKVKKEYGQLKSDWKQYMEDWHDLRSMATGGSPLARVFRSADAGVTEGLILGKFGDRLLETLARYTDHGAAPKLMQKLRMMDASLKALPKAGKIPDLPKSLELPAPPKLKEVEPPKLPPPVDPALIRRHKLEDMAGRPFRWYDLFPPYLLEHILLKSPRVREYVANIPRKADAASLAAQGDK